VLAHDPAEFTKVFPHGWIAAEDAYHTEVTFQGDTSLLELLDCHVRAFSGEVRRLGAIHTCEIAATGDQYLEHAAFPHAGATLARCDHFR
jgi:hypothetical protein